MVGTCSDLIVGCSSLLLDLLGRSLAFFLPILEVFEHIEEVCRCFLFAIHVIKCLSKVEALVTVQSEALVSFACHDHVSLVFGALIQLPDPLRDSVAVAHVAIAHNDKEGAVSGLTLQQLANAVGHRGVLNHLSWEHLSELIRGRSGLVVHVTAGDEGLKVVVMLLRSNQSLTSRHIVFFYSSSKPLFEAFPHDGPSVSSRDKASMQFNLCIPSVL